MVGGAERKRSGLKWHSTLCKCHLHIQIFSIVGLKKERVEGTCAIFEPKHTDLQNIKPLATKHQLDLPFARRKKKKLRSSWAHSDIDSLHLNHKETLADILINVA